MKYANVIFDGKRKSSVNIGDDLQLVAIENLYMAMGIDYKDVIRIGFSELSSYDGEYVILPISFPFYGYREGLNITMFSPKIIPVFLGLSVMGGNISEEEILYLRRFEPIGCRDYYTVEWLREKNICAYLNGCLTATLPRCTGGGKDIYLVDIPTKYYPYIPKELRNHAHIKSQILYDCEDPEETVKTYLQEYAENARLVITTRLHCALPCIAMGIPVILMKDRFSFRFTTLARYIPIYTREEFGEIDWNPQPVEYEAEKKMILQSAAKRIQDAYDKYGHIFDISQFYEKQAIHRPVWVEHYDNVVEDIKEHFQEDDEIPYAVWGITQKADLICSYMENHYKNAKLIVVYDRNKKVTFHGVMSTQQQDAILKKGVFVFVTTATANEAAVKLFQTVGKTEYHISTDGIGE